MPQQNMKQQCWPRYKMLHLHSKTWIWNVQRFCIFYIVLLKNTHCTDLCRYGDVYCPSLSMLFVSTFSTVLTMLKGYDWSSQVERPNFDHGFAPNGSAFACYMRGPTLNGSSQKRKTNYFRFYKIHGKKNKNMESKQSVLSLELSSNAT